MPGDFGSSNGPDSLVWVMFLSSLFVVLGIFRRGPGVCETGLIVIAVLLLLGAIMALIWRLK